MILYCTVPYYQQKGSGRSKKIMKVQNSTMLSLSFSLFLSLSLSVVKSIYWYFSTRYSISISSTVPEPTHLYYSIHVYTVLLLYHDCTYAKTNYTRTCIVSLCLIILRLKLQYHSCFKNPQSGKLKPNKFLRLKFYENSCMKNHRSGKLHPDWRNYVRFSKKGRKITNLSDSPIWEVPRLEIADLGTP